MGEVFFAFLRLGCFAFGGPVAHLSYFREEFVSRRGWLSNDALTECVAISQLLPGPASSQTGMLIGLLRAGWPGALAAWVGFTLPSALIMGVLGAKALSLAAFAGVFHGLLLAAVAVVASALIAMRAALVRTLTQFLLMGCSAAAALRFHAPLSTPAIMLACALGGAFFLRAPEDAGTAATLSFPASRRLGAVAALLFAGLIVAAAFTPASRVSPLLAVACKLFEVGGLVFGGGHVVLPLMQAQVVEVGITSAAQLIAGYAAAQAMPGPLFTLSSFVGASAFDGSLGWQGAAVATAAIFAPSFLLLAAVLPVYNRVRVNRIAISAIGGVNAGVVGLLAAAFVTPIWTSSVRTPADAAIAAAAFVALVLFRLAPVLVVAMAALLGAIALR